MRIQHHPIVFRKISEVEPIVEIYEGVMDCDYCNIIVSSHLMIRQTIIILKTVKSILIVVPKDRFIQNLNNRHDFSQFWCICPSSNLTHDSNCTIDILVSEKSNISSTTRMIISILMIQKEKTSLALFTSKKLLIYLRTRSSMQINHKLKSVFLAPLSRLDNIIPTSTDPRLSCSYI